MELTRALVLEKLRPFFPDPGTAAKLFLASFLALYFEVVIIRYLSSEVRVFAYLKNLPLIAAFLGIGLGMILGRGSRRSGRDFPIIAALLFLLIAYAAPLHLTHIPLPGIDEYFHSGALLPSDLSIAILLFYVAVVLAIVGLVVSFFVVLGGLVGEYLSRLPPLTGYGLNLAGSLAGISAFALLAYFSLPPAVWILIGFAAALPFFYRDRVARVLFVGTVLAVALPQANTYWSPYYRITLRELPSPADWASPSAYFLTVNHDYHQKMVDLSPPFVRRYPDAEPNRSAYLTYELPYRLVPRPGEVLVVGAGTGNDVAAALRHGADRVDAVEIDPIIVKLGTSYHPERPYQSPRVRVHVDDARAFFKKTRNKYDLIVFGYLDSHTLLTSFSSLRLDNYVYTLESFQEARNLLKDNGTLILAFSSGKTFVTDRLYATLKRAFGQAPTVYYTEYDTGGVVFVEGAAREATAPVGLPAAADHPPGSEQSHVLATDAWPFLYLRGRTIPFSVVLVLVPFLYGARELIRRSLKLTRRWDPTYNHLFLLGAGFLLLETKAVTELSLLFGSTWIVNAVVIGAFISMALLANAVIMLRPIHRALSYLGLFFLLALGLVVPYSLFDGLSTGAKVAAAGAFAGLPVFFSGLIFSRSFREVARPSEALGMNLLGAVVGGALENTVTLGGTPILAVLAIVLYGLSAIFAARQRR